MINKKPKIANILEEGKLSGPAHRVVRVAMAIRNDVDTIVLMPNLASDDYQALCKKNGLIYKTMDLTKLTKKPLILAKYAVFFPYEIFKIYKFLINESIDVVHVSGGSWQYKGVIAGFFAKKKVLWHINDTSMPSIIRMFFSIFSTLPSSYVYASIRSKNYYEPLIKTSQPSHVVPAPVDVTIFDPKVFSVMPQEIQSIKEKNSDALIVGLVGNVSPVKGIEFFVEAASLVKSTFPVYYVVIGNIFESQSKYYKKINQLVGKLNFSNLLFIENITDVKPYLHFFDIYTCTSNFESSPISVWEAMSMAKAIVSTDVGDVSMYIEHGANGYITKTKDVSSIAKYISHLLNNPKIRYEFGKKSRKIAVDNLSLEICANNHIKVYKECLQ